MGDSYIWECSECGIMVGDNAIDWDREYYGSREKIRCPVCKKTTDYGWKFQVG